MYRRVRARGSGLWVLGVVVWIAAAPLRASPPSLPFPPVVTRLRLDIPHESPPPLAFDLELEPPDRVLETLVRHAPALKRAEVTKSELLFAWGYCLWRVGQGPAAREALEAYLTGGGCLAPYADWVLGEIYLDTGKPATARVHFRRARAALPSGPVSIRAALGLYRVARAQGRGAEARRGLEALLATARDSHSRAAVRLELAATCAAQGDVSRAIAHYEKIWSEVPDLPEAAAAGAALEALAGDPDVTYPGPAPAVWLKRATHLQSAGRPEQAVKELVALAGDPSVRPRLPATFPFELAVARFRAKQYGEALEQFSAWASTVTGDAQADALYWVAMTLGRLGNLDEAVARYEQIVAEYPKSDPAGRALYKIGLLRLDQGRYAEAQDAFQRLSASRPAWVTCSLRWFLAWTQLRQGKAREAMQQYQTLIDDFPGCDLAPGAHYWQGRIALATGDRASAVAAFETAAAPSFPSSYAALARILLQKLGVTPPEPGVQAPPGERSGLEPQLPDGLRCAGTLYRLGLVTWARWEARRVRLASRETAGMLGLLLWYQQVGDYHMALEYAVSPPRDEPIPARSTHSAAWRIRYPEAFRRALRDLTWPENVSPRLVYAIMRQESRFDRWAVSPAGARGPMQLMPETAAAVAETLGMPAPETWALHDPTVAVTLGARLLAQHLERFGGNLPLAVAAYNAGEEAVARWLQARPGLPIDVFLEEISYAETRRYVRKVLANLWVYCRMYGQGVDDFASGIPLDPGIPPWRSGRG